MTITDKKIINEVNVYHQNKNTTSNVICHGISYGKGDLKFSVNGYIKKGMTGSLCNQSSRIINLDDGKSLIEPNLFVEEFDSVANHSAYTGPFDEKSLFYLETKGISRKEAFNLLLSGFMKLVDLPKEYENILDMLLNKVMRRVIIINREDFPILKNDIIYFDNGATTLKPKCVIEAMNDYYYNYCANIHRGDYKISLEASNAYEEVRNKVAKFIGAKSPNEIVFTSGATDGLNKIVFGFMMII